MQMTAIVLYSIRFSRSLATSHLQWFVFFSVFILKFFSRLFGQFLHSTFLVWLTRFFFTIINSDDDRNIFWFFAFLRGIQMFSDFGRDENTMKF